MGSRYPADPENRAVQQQRGFTLIEAVISLFLIAVISVMSYQALSLIIQVNERSRTDLADEAQLHRAWQIINRDLLHLRKRSFKDGLGATEKPYITDNSQFGVRFSRGGGPMLRTNPSGIRRVEYSLNNEQQLVRRSWAITESPRYSDGAMQILVNKVAKVEFEHLDKNSNFGPTWPPLSGASGDLPRMIRVTISLENGTETSRLFLGANS